jgi:DinB superfamily
VSELEPILENLARAQRTFLRSADAIPAEQWRTTPEPDRWSAGEVVAHLIMVERAVIGAADRVLQKPPKYFPPLKRLHLPLLLVEARVVRRKSPIPLDPNVVRGKEEMLAELREVRERTLAFIKEMKGRELGAYRWRHAFLGSLNTYEWFQMIASHENRHEKQIREIAAGLPKVIASLQK